MEDSEMKNAFEAMESAVLSKRILAVALIFVMTLLVPGVHISRDRARAASSDKRYLSEVKLFIKDNATYDDAKAWCDTQEENKDDDKSNDWQVLDGDLNAGAASKLDVVVKNSGVFLCYRETSDPGDAIRDMAVMNEKGNYSEDEYKLLLQKQKDAYIDMVNNMKDMLKDYRANYKDGVPTAVNAHDYLNTFIEDDTNTPLGDLLINISDDKLVDVLLQANGQVILIIEQQLSAACESGKNTWLDRLSKTGGYKKFRQKFMTAAKNNASQAKKAMDKLYREKTESILSWWSDLHKRFDEIDGFIKAHGIDAMTQEQFNEWVSDMKTTDKEFASYQEFTTLSSLIYYKYKDETLFGLFSKSEKEIKKEGIETLYPLVSSLNDGQLAALDQSVSLFEMIRDALGANIYNNYSTGKNAEITKNMTNEQKSILDDTRAAVDDFIKEQTDGEKISIYEGVDREVFDGGVAVTSDASTFSKGSETSWAMDLVDSGKLKTLNIILGAGAVMSAIGVAGFARLANCQLYFNMDTAVEEVGTWGTRYNYVMEKCNFSDDFVKTVKGHFTDVDDLKEAAKTSEDAKLAYKELVDKTPAASGNYYKWFIRLKTGFTVFMILLAVADIALTVYALYNYYNTEHLPIPHHMVDLSYDENRETSYITYKSVLDQNGDYGNVNGKNCKQWLALYSTKDEDAGAPILAPGSSERMKVVYGSDKTPDGYSPLHMFGTPEVAQNLTFADGESGYSYNDEKNGTYLFFTRDSSDIPAEDELAGANDPDEDRSLTTGDSAGEPSVSAEGTALTSGTVFLGTGVGLVAGVIIGVVGAGITRRRRK